MSLQLLELKLNIQRAETAKMELLYKIEKNKDEIKRLEDHIIMQDKVIEDIKEKLKGMGD